MAEYVGIDAASLLRWLDGEIADAEDGIKESVNRFRYAEANSYQVQRDTYYAVKVEFQKRTGAAKDDVKVIDVGPDYITLRVGGVRRG